jgi:hypothetical protein
VSCAAFGVGTAGCPLPAVTVPGQGEDGGEQAGEGVAGACGAASAVPAAGIGGHVAADEGEDGGEGDEAGAGAGQGCGAGGGGGRHVVDEQQRPCFLPGESGGLAAQGAAGAADGLLQVEERDLNRPPLMPVKRELSLA